VAGAWIGMILALTTWLIVCSAEFGEVTIDNLGTLNPNLAGNIVALSSSMLIHIGLSMAMPQNYDFKSMGEIKMLEDDQSGLAAADYTTEFLDEALAWIYESREAIQGVFLFFIGKKKATDKGAAGDAAPAAES
jgi:hypothetical protein